MAQIQTINSEALTWLWDQPDNSVGAVVTDPPEEKDCPNLQAILRQCLRVSSGPVIVLAPLIWEHEGVEGARHAPRLDPAPDHTAFWLTTLGELRGVAPIFCWRTQVGIQKHPVPVLAATGHKPGLKPVALFQALIQSLPDGIILDPFAGNGTTGVAAQRSGRPAVLLDKNPEMVGRARQRLGLGDSDEERD